MKVKKVKIRKGKQGQIDLWKDLTWENCKFLHSIEIYMQILPNLLLLSMLIIHQTFFPLLSLIKNKFDSLLFYNYI